MGITGSNPPAQPLSREALFRNVGPLVGAAFLGLLSFAISQASKTNAPMLVQAATLASLTIAALLLIPWQRLPITAQIAPALSFLIVALMVRHSTGGPNSIYAQLVLVPILWLAVYGTAIEVIAGVISLTMALGASLLLTPEPQAQVVGAVLLVVLASVIGFGVQRLFGFLRAHAAQLDLLAKTDPLTGASNRRAWDEELEEILSSVESPQSPPCVAMIDLDHFKEYNDSHGHQAGDRLLKEVTAQWQSILRDGDVLARLGGDEFGIVLPACPMHAARRIMQRLREGMPKGATCSTGLAVWDGLETASELIARADRALYGAKESGRDRIVIV